jgi:hypothetical protein
MSGTDLKFKRIGKTDIYGYQSSKYVNFQYLDGSRVKAVPFTRGACAEASAGAITCIIWCNTSQYTPIQALSPRPRAAALIPSSPSLGNLRKSFASDVNIHVSNPRVPSPASNALSLALKTEEATRGDRWRSCQLVLHKSEHLRPYFIHAPSVNEGSFELAIWITTWSPARGSRWTRAASFHEIISPRPRTNSPQIITPSFTRWNAVRATHGARAHDPSEISVRTDIRQ